MLTTLSKLPLLSHFIDFCKNKARLAIEYALIAAVVTLAGVVLTMWFQKEQLRTSVAQLEGNVLVLRIANDGHKLQIQSLEKERLQDAKALSGLINDVRDLAERDTAWRKNLGTLESKNEVVRRYLDSPIPADLECMLDETCGTGNRPAVGAKSTAR